VPLKGILMVNVGPNKLWTTTESFAVDLGSVVEGAAIDSYNGR